ncbi:MAG: type II toxin-antitoxin system HicB family antitoxin [Methanospirillum sp.]
MQHLKIVVEEHADGFIAYPVGLRGAVVGQGDTYEAAVDDVVSAIRFHIETFGPDAIDAEVLDARLAEVTV